MRVSASPSPIGNPMAIAVNDTYTVTQSPRTRSVKRDSQTIVYRLVASSGVAAECNLCYRGIRWEDLARSAHDAPGCPHEGPPAQRGIGWFPGRRASHGRSLNVRPIHFS